MLGALLVIRLAQFGTRQAKTTTSPNSISMIDYDDDVTRMFSPKTTKWTTNRNRVRRDATVCCISAVASAEKELKHFHFQ